MKVITLEIGALHAVFWRTLISTLLAGALFARARLPLPTRADWPTHLQRALTICIASISFFYGLSRMPFADAVALSFLAPLLMVIMASWFLGETMRPSALGAGVIGLAGVLVIVGGRLEALGTQDALIGAGAILVAAVAYAAGQVILRKQAQSQPGLAVAFIQSGLVTLCLAIPVALTPGLPPATLWPWIFAASVLTTTSQLLLVAAFARAQTQALAPLEYTAFLWAVLLGWGLFGEALTLATLAGALMIIAACVLATRTQA